MARNIRIEGFTMSWPEGTGGKRIFFDDDDDRRYFLNALGEACAMTGWRVHAWVLMDNLQFIDSVRI